MSEFTIMMKLKIIDKCCNEYFEHEIKYSDIKNLKEILPSKKGHKIIVNSDMTIEYIKRETLDEKEN